MSLETGAYIPDLVATNPVGATDFVSQGDDHIRLLKVCIQGSFPDLGTGAVTCTVAELNKLTGLLTTAAELGYVHNVTSAIQTQLDAKLGIAAAAAAYQPLDADLTAIAALATTTFGRGFLDLADLAAFATKVQALNPTWSDLHTFNGKVVIGVPASGVALSVTGLGGQAAGSFSGGASAGYIKLIGNSASWSVSSGTGGSGFFALYDDTNAVVAFSINASDVVSVNDAGTLREVGFRNLPTRDVNSSGSILATDNGKTISFNAAGTVTIANVAGSGLRTTGLVTLLNTTGAATLSLTTGVLYWFNGSGTIATGSRTLAVGAVVTIFMKVEDSTCFIWGTGIS